MIKKKNQKGVTLVEVMVALAVSSLIIVAAFNFFWSGTKSYHLGINKASIQNEVNLAAYILSNEIKYAEEIYLIESVPQNPDEYYYLFLEKDEKSEIYYLAFLSPEKGLEKKTDAIFDLSEAHFEIIDKLEGGYLLEFNLKAFKIDYNLNSKVALPNIKEANETSNKVLKFKKP
ncbi:prepilin-type N-terminal cleavage/methylation domain-containing protein [Herbivorax sp. ANBcel31]|uniref:PilW family protein n=1 Tax=Herbivorax sp. ANBcel31 TaxID=3069754 RepID=UPI0027B1C0C5|nr:prepilin-type N-terminal cleavage/methylation domain-containing protein [Herbivorax sp. ANBcel31]MDQ2087830.1 prepilin-type N-terminal cleavage/methylation domain-containing protein [Herbivorax sp. ANBcel31]